MTQSHRKGAVGELEVRNLIQPWWAAVEPATRFNRAPLSGGWHAAADQQTAGDLLVTPGSKWPWSVEVKRREGWSPARALSGLASPLWTWWAQATRDAATIGLYPMLWARRSRGQWIVLVPEKQYLAQRKAPIPRYQWISWPPKRYMGTDWRTTLPAPIGYFALDLLDANPRVWI
jgi:hypothetical protein